MQANPLDQNLHCWPLKCDAVILLSADASPAFIQGTFLYMFVACISQHDSTAASTLLKILTPFEFP